MRSRLNDVRFPEPVQRPLGHEIGSAMLPVLLVTGNLGGEAGKRSGGWLSRLANDDPHPL